MDYELDLPSDSALVNPMFHVSLLNGELLRQQQLRL